MADDLMQLQRQAAHRVQQMQAHSRRVFEAHQGRPPEGLTEPEWGIHSPGLYARPAPPEVTPTAPAPPPPPTMESDQWLLLGLALLLARGGCQTELLLALLYLAL